MLSNSVTKFVKYLRLIYQDKIDQSPAENGVGKSRDQIFSASMRYHGRLSLLGRPHGEGIAEA